jgi:hypothetical protein
VKIVGVIRPTATEEITVEADSYTAGVAAIKEQVPEGYELLLVRQEK